MELVATLPPRPPRSIYGQLLLDMQAHPNEWFRILPNEVRNTPVPRLRIYFGQLAKRQGVKIETTLRGGNFYVRVTE